MRQAKQVVFLIAFIAAVACYAIEEPIITDTTHPRATLAPLSGVEGFQKDLRVYVRENGKKYAISTNASVVMYYGTNLKSTYVGTAASTSIDTNTGSSLVRTVALPSGTYQYALALAESGRTNDLGTGLMVVKASSFGGVYYPIPGQTIDYERQTWTNFPWVLTNQVDGVTILWSNDVLVVAPGGAGIDATARAAIIAETNRAQVAEAELYPRSNPSNYVTAAITSGVATAAQGANADTAYGWGDHSTNGYLTPPATQGLATVVYVTNAINQATGSLVTVESDPIYTLDKTNYTLVSWEDGEYYFHKVGDPGVLDYVYVSGVDYFIYPNQSATSNFFINLSAGNLGGILPESGFDDVRPWTMNNSRIVNATWGATNYADIDRTITINGTSGDLSTNLNFTIAAGGGSGDQTPLTNNVAGDGYSITNVGNVQATGTVTATKYWIGTSVYWYFNGTGIVEVIP